MWGQTARFHALIGAALIAPAVLAGASSACAQSASDVFTVALPVTVDERRLPSLLVETTVAELVSLPPAALAASLSDLLNPEAAAALAGLGSDMRPVADLHALGYGVRLNPQTLSIEIDIPVAQRAASSASLAEDWGYSTANALYPQGRSFGVTGALQLSDTLSDDEGAAADLGLDGFANFGGAEGYSLDWGGRIAWRSGGETDFRRQRLIAFTDRPDQARRYSAGDLSPQLARNTGILNLAGISMETNYRDLQPTRNIRPTGSRTLILERRSTVEVYVNGALIDRFLAEPGPIDLQDIPLANVSNDVTIVVEDGLGRREIDSFSLSADVSLLSPGLSESVLAAGFRRTDQGGEFDYDFDAPVIGGHYALGVSPSLTLSGSAAVTPELVSLGGAVSRAMLGGVGQLDVTFSEADALEQDYAVAVNFRGGPYLGPERYATVNLRLNYAGPDFASLNDLASENDQRWSLGGDVRFNLTDRTAVNFGAVYQDAHALPERAYTLTAGMNRRFGEIVLAATARHSEFEVRGSETVIFLTLSRRLGARQIVSSSYDSSTGASRLEYRALRDRDLPSLSGRASVANQGGVVDLRGQLATETTRYAAQFNAAHTPAADGRNEASRLSVRLQSGIALADGAVAIGRDPGRGFAIIDRHTSLRDAEILVSTGAGGRTEARADQLGAAVVSLPAAYRPQDLRIGARGLEPGYYIGPGRYTVVPGALTGLRITVGTEAYRTAVGVLRSGAEPVALQYGEIRNLESGAVSVFFTNRAGRAAFNELIPGRYEGRLADGQLFRFELPTDAPAYIDLGEILLEAGHD
ncbi:fimbria/pilus outer membrane usher protein [Maricaulis sp.]|uniref:fimbria/pilus outer membrane usher protein n=1 Tax=Maricaulis sp. TaxID=1486257 RepID=UPI00261A0F88|nr:fimbria/pilus outer membrane usher protein [Maricaulis sp.]